MYKIGQKIRAINDVVIKNDLATIIDIEPEYITHRFLCKSEATGKLSRLSIDDFSEYIPEEKKTGGDLFIEEITFDDVTCPNCFGDGYVDGDVFCWKPASDCCGGCIEKELCDRCNGEGLIAIHTDKFKIQEILGYLAVDDPDGALKSFGQIV